MFGSLELNWPARGHRTWLLALLISAAGEAFAQTPPATDDEFVMVWRRVRNDFHEPGLPAALITDLVRKTPSAPMIIQSNETISSKLRDTFNVSSTWTPTMYQSLMGRIVELNQLSNPDKVPAGTQLMVPLIPYTGKQLRVPTPTFTGQNLRIYGSPAIDTRINSLGTAVVSLAPQREVQYFLIRRSELKNFLLDNEAEQGVSMLVSVQFTQGAGSAASPTLSPKATDAIKTSLNSADSTRPHPVIVVMDDSIPDNIEYVRSVRFVLEMSKAIRDHYSLKESPYTTDLQNLPAALPGANPSSLYPNLVLHSAMIKHSLQEFSALDSDGRVSVIYLPLGATQVGLSPLLKEIRYLAELIKMVDPQSPPLTSSDIRQREAAKKLVDEAAERQPAVYVFGPGAGGVSMQTDQALLEAFGIVLAYYSDATARPHALSFSWTVSKLDVPAYFVPSYGLKFAAAGNHPDSVLSQNFLSMELQFASRAALQTDFVAVLNATGATPGCRSNIFDDSAVQVASLAYTGTVAPAICGTSFATPRVAWLMAAREAALGQKLAARTPVAKIAWLQKQAALISALKATAKPDVLQRYAIDPVQLFTH